MTLPATGVGTTTSTAPAPLRNVYVSFSVNGTVVLDWPRHFSLTQEYGQHDVLKATIIVPYLHPNISQLTAWADNAPISVTWGRLSPMTISTWYGYVNHHELQSTVIDGKRAVQMDYYIIGTSKPMNTAVNKTWLNVTGSAIAQQLATKYFLRAVITNSTWTLDYEVQAGETDFNFLARIAQKIGYRFYVSGGTMYFVDPLMMFASASTSFIFTYNIDNSLGYADTAWNFHRLAGDNLPGSAVATRQICGIDDSTNALFTVTPAAAASVSALSSVTAVPTPGAATGTTTSGILVQRNDKFARNTAEAQSMVNAVQQLAQFQVGCTVDVQGNNLLYPGKTITLAGKALPDTAAGLYFITKTVHQIYSSGWTDATKDVYKTSVTALKSSKSAVPAAAGIQQISPELVGMSLSGSQWQSSQQGTVTEGTN